MVLRLLRLGSFVRDSCAYDCARLGGPDCYSRETADVDPAKAQAVLALVSMLAGLRGEQAAWALAQLLDPRQHLRAAEALLRTYAD